MNDTTIPTRDRILNAAIKVFSTRGYHDTRIDDIVEESNTSKGSVYFHFKSKQEIFLGLIDSFIELLENRISTIIDSNLSGSDQLIQINTEIIRLFGQYRSLSKLVLVQAMGLGQIFETKRRLVNDRFCLLIQKRLDKAVSDGSIDPIDTSVVARLWVGGMNEMINHWIFNPDQDIEESITDINNFFINSINYQEK